MELFFLFLLLISITGIVYLVWQKTFILVELPIEKKSFKKETTKEKPKKKKFSIEKILHKFLSSTRVLVLRIEKKISDWLQKLRTANKTKEENDSYWENLKK